MVIKPISTVAALLLSVSSFAATPAFTYKFQTVDYKGNPGIATGIDKDGVTTADYTDANGNPNCFTMTRTQQHILNDHKGKTTFCSDINDHGAVVGYYTTASTDVGFFYVSTFSDIPGPAGSVSSRVYSINDKAVMIGAWMDQSKAEHGFLLKGKTYTSFDEPNSTATVGVGINDAGDYTAQGTDSHGTVHSYLTTAGGTIELIFPGATVTRVHAINDKGQMALDWVDASNVQHGGIYDSKTATYTQIDVPNASATAVIGIDNKKSLAGSFIATNGGDLQGFRAFGHLK